MKRTGKKVIIVGAGAAGLSAGIGLAQRGHDVSVIERRSAVQLLQRNAMSPPERLCQATAHDPQDRLAAQESLRELVIFSRRLPESLLDLPAWYLAPNASLDTRICSEDPNDQCPVSQACRRMGMLRMLRINDRIIDPERVVQTLAHRLISAGGRILFNAEAIGGRRFRSEIRRVVARTPRGEQRLPCDVFVNAAGSRLAQVSKRIGSGDAIAGIVKLCATPVMRIAWPFSIEPAILQFFGTPTAPMFNNLRITPLGRPRTALVTTSHWVPIDDPDHIAIDLQASRRELLHSIAAGFDVLDVPEPINMAWEIRSMAADRASPAVLCGATVGGSTNEFHCVSENLRSVLTLRTAVCSAVDEFIRTRRRLVAA